MHLHSGSKTTSFRRYLSQDPSIIYYLRNYTNKSYGNYNNCVNKKNNNGGKISKDGYFKGKKLCGKVQVVDSFPDFKVQVVNNFPDLKVQKVESFPIEMGKWQFVDSFPDFTIQYVNYFPDFKIQFVDYFPGVYYSILLIIINLNFIIYINQNIRNKKIKGKKSNKYS